MIWPCKKHPTTPAKTLLVEGYESYGDDRVYQYFWLLIEYSDGRRVVEKQPGKILPNKKGMDMSIPPRVRAWELGEPIAQPLIVDLTKLDRDIENEVMQ